MRIQSIEFHMKCMTNNINHSLKESTFPGELKQSELYRYITKIDSLQNENDRLMSLLPHVSKAFERAIYRQIHNFMENKISKCVTEFRK